MLDLIKEVDTEEIKLIYKGIKSSLSKDLLKENISKIDFKNFKNNLVKLLNELETASDNKQGEENRKNLFRDFLKQSFYEGKYFLNTMSYKGNNEADLVIHSENNQNIEFPKEIYLALSKNIFDSNLDSKYYANHPIEEFFKTLKGIKTLSIGGDINLGKNKEIEKE